jgi:hypothetical protein
VRFKTRRTTLHGHSPDPEAPPLEYLRQLREEGVSLGERTFYRIFRLEKEALMVRFEGVAGES